MTSAHNPAGTKTKSDERGVSLFALVGNPNCGKTTVFNALTGLRQKVGNYPGVTVERKIGDCFSQHGHLMRVIDLRALTVWSPVLRTRRFFARFRGSKNSRA